jgi:drug/metabolite transporter (DMT)-like permease
VGIVFALACAVFWAFAVIFLKKTGENVGPFALNLFRVLFSIPLIITALLVTGTPLFRAAPPRDLLALVASGILGIAVADTLFHKSLNMVGAGITAIIDTFYSPCVVILAFALLHERIGLRDILGMALIMGAVLLSATLTPPPHRTHRQLAAGIVIGLAGLFLLSFGVVIAKPVLNRSPVLWVTLVRQVASGIVLLASALISRQRAEHLRVFRPSRVWKTMVPGAVLGSFLSLICWLAAMKYTLASIAAILTQSSTLFILVFAVLFLGERFTRRRVASAALAVAGVLLVSWR